MRQLVRENNSESYRRRSSGRGNIDAGIGVPGAADGSGRAAGHGHLCRGQDVDRYTTLSEESYFPWV